MGDGTGIIDFYRGGMILFDMELAYRYERWLAKMLAHREERWWRKDFRLREYMWQEFDAKKWPAEAFHIMPGDPLVHIPEVPRILFLKSRYLHRLRLQAVKRIRRAHGRKVIVKGRT